ncbi:DUF333 domain-containing protein [Brevundimonas staleyi]|uniref:DUF333 domain-containing protein n=1 Tax=Brevundimonas staleyi TaxID=74326 RepID=A0ABW0FTC5_9CAUL
MRIAGLIAALLLTTACTAAPETRTAPPPEAAEAPPAPVIGMANPASVACGDLFGGELSIVDGPDGQSGMCTLPDGRVCEEWVLFQDHRCAVNRDGPSIGEPVTPRPPQESRRHAKSGKTGG